MSQNPNRIRVRFGDVPKVSIDMHLRETSPRTP